MKSIAKFLLCLILCFLITAVLLKQTGMISRVKSFRDSIRLNRILNRLHTPTEKYASLPALPENKDAYFSKYHFIAHNGGIIQGRKVSDSLEAWKLSYLRGVRIIDADVNFTADNHLVLRHSWSEDIGQGTPRIMSYEEYKAAKIFMKYTPMDIEDMFAFMQAHDDLYVAVDVKQDVRRTYTELVRTARNMNAENVLSRIIVSLYRTEDVAAVREIYPFSEYVLRQYGWSHNWYELAEFCVNNNIPVVNVFNFVIDGDPEGIKILTDKGIHVYAAVVNSLTQMQKYKDMGITGAVSDYLSEEDWELLK